MSEAEAPANAGENSRTYYDRQAYRGHIAAAYLFIGGVMFWIGFVAHKLWSVLTS